MIRDEPFIEGEILVKLFHRMTGLPAILDKICVYQIVSKMSIVVWLSVLRNLFGLLLRSTGRVASQERFLCSSADAIITDEVVQAEETIKKLEARTDEQRMSDKLLKWL